MVFGYVTGANCAEKLTSEVSTDVLQPPVFSDVQLHDGTFARSLIEWDSQIRAGAIDGSIGLTMVRTVLATYDHEHIYSDFMSSLEQFVSNAQ